MENKYLFFMKRAADFAITEIRYRNKAASWGVSEEDKLDYKNEANRFHSKSIDSYSEALRHKNQKKNNNQNFRYIAKIYVSFGYVEFKRYQTFRGAKIALKKFEKSIGADWLACSIEDTMTDQVLWEQY